MMINGDYIWSGLKILERALDKHILREVNLDDLSLIFLDQITYH